MNRNDCYICLHRDLDTNKYQVEFLENQEQLHNLLSRLNDIQTSTKQSMTEFAYVFPKGFLYPANYDEFWKARQDKGRKHNSVYGLIFVQRTFRNGKVKQKFYDWAEDFDWMLEDWKDQDVIILDTNEAYSGDYVYDRDVVKVWGDKELLFEEVAYESLEI